MPDWEPDAKAIAHWGNMRADDIVSIENPFTRSAAIQSWLAARDERDETVVKLALVGKDKQMIFNHPYQGKKFTIDQANGRNVRPKNALDLLTMYGKNGTYRNIDQASGFDEMDWVAYQARKEAEAKVYARVMERQGHWPKGEPQFLHSYLTHVLDSDAADSADDGDVAKTA